MWLLFLILMKEPMPPTFEGVEKVGCRCEEVTDKNKVTWWRTYIWVETQTGLYHRLYSIRTKEERKKALLDCERWLQAFHKELEKYRKAPRRSHV